MLEADIRPDQFHDKILAISRRDLDNLLLNYADEFVTVGCPACGSTNSSSCFQKLGINYETCCECTTMFVNPRPSPEVLTRFYQHAETYKYWNSTVFPATAAIRKKKLFQPRAEKIIKLCSQHHIPTDALLEIGAGFGLFSETIKAMNVFNRVIGLESTPSLATSCRTKGLEVIEGMIESTELPDVQFNVITAFEVLEHLFSPQQFLRRCHQLLTADGLLVMTTPNCLGFDIQLLGPVSDSVDHEHLNYLSPDSLADLLERCSFKPLEILTPGELDVELVRKKVLAGEFNLEHRPFLKRVLLDDWQTVGESFQRFLAENKLSSHMWAVARKA